MKAKDGLEKCWEVVVIGGGPAGMMAAGRAAELGCPVLLLEKNQDFGRKLLLTGGGRCNLTNQKPDLRVLLANYKEAGKFLYSAFSQFGVEETREFFRERGLETKEEAEGRVFPVSERADSVLDCLLEYMEAGGVEIRKGVEVTEVCVDKDGLFVIETTNEKIMAKCCVLATGGTTYPETGSTGAGFNWLKKLGHAIAEPEVALVPIVLRDKWITKLSGVTLPEVELTVCQNDRSILKKSGSLLFTHFGLSGPMVINISREIGKLLNQGEVLLELDLRPDLDEVELRKELQTIMIGYSNKLLKNTLGELVVGALVEPILELAGFDGQTPNHSVTKTQRLKLVQLIKLLPLTVAGLQDSTKAIYSAGGVKLEEVDMKTMQSRLIPNLYIVGDLLNIDRPSGGYSLQLCWTTGYVAGNSINNKQLAIKN